MIDYDEDVWIKLLFSMNGSVLPKSAMWAAPSATLSVLLLYADEWFPGQREDLGFLEIRHSQLWTAVTAALMLMIGFRTRQAFARFWEGTGLLHQMRGEWFDTVSNCVTFSIPARADKPEEVTTFRHTIIRIMSLCHGSALEEIAGNNIQLESIDTFGLDDGTLNHLQECHNEYNFNKVEVMLHLLQSLITCAHHEGVLRVPAPVLSRVYQTISRGFVNLLNAKKIQDTKFPFPYSQLIAFLMVVMNILTPCMMSVLVPSKVFCAIFTFIPVFGVFCLNFIGAELEDPFGTDDNDLPLEHFQTEMNNCLMMLLHPNTDLIATISDRCVMDFQTLRHMVCLNDDDLAKAEEEGKVGRQTRRLSDFGVDGQQDEAGESNSQNGADAEQPMEIEEEGFYQGENLSKPQRSSRRSSGGSIESDDGYGKAAKDRLPPGQSWPHQRRASTDKGGSAQTGRRGSRGSTPSNGSRDRAGNVEGWKEYRSRRYSSDSAEDHSPGSSSAQRKSPDAVKVNIGDIEGAGFMAGTMDSLMLQVGTEKDPSPRQNPRMQSPMSMLNGMEPEFHKQMATTNGLGHSNGEAFNELAGQLQPLLAQNMEDLLRSLDDWTKSINREVDSLQSNSMILQNALQRFNSDLPGMKAKVSALK